MDLQVLPEIENNSTGLFCLIGPSGSGKTTLLKEISASINCKIININRFISEKIYTDELNPDSQNIDIFLRNHARKEWSNTICLDNTEVIFSKPFNDLLPFSMFSSISKNMKIIMTVSARIQGDLIYFGDIGHVDYKKISRNDIDAQIFSLDTERWI